jgi:Leucine-rich repeat (LRR) protein
MKRNAIFHLIMAMGACLALAGCSGLADFLGITKEDPSAKVFADYEKKIPSADLRASLAEAVGTPFGKMTVGEAESLVWVDLKQRDVASLEGIQYFKSMQWILAFDSAISDASALAQLPGLRGCYMAKNRISSLDPFLMCHGIEQLYLIQNPLPESEIFNRLTPGNFPSLKGLQLSGYDEDTGDLLLSFARFKSLVASLPNLVRIGADNFHMSDADFASFYSAILEGKKGTMEELWLAKNQLTDTVMPSISELANLSVLCLMENGGISDISGIAGMTKMRELFLGSTSVSDVAPLKTLYDNGGLRAKGSHVELYGLALELGTLPLTAKGQANQAAIDYLLSKGVAVNY